jgi:glycine/D-amino acid oxidase-like deaminating enzyme
MLAQPPTIGCWLVTTSSITGQGAAETVSGCTRRDLLRGALAAGALGGARRAAPAEPARTAATVGRELHIAVVGAGVFGSFTALALRDRGARVTLVDPWGPGNARSSSGGETRVIRGVYGSDATYTELAALAFQQWPVFEARVGRRFLRPTGALWLVLGDDAFVRAAMPVLAAHRLPHEELTAAAAAARWPQIRFDGVRWALYEPRAGYLLARQACAAAVEALVTAGGELRTAAALPGAAESGRLGPLHLSDASRLTADIYVFAAGPWLPRLFPEALRGRLKPTRQDVLFFGTPERDRRFDEEQMPVWIEFGERVFYGIPGNERRGFKVADDTRGPEFDPTAGERLVAPESLARARELLARRFPALTEAPLVESRVCQYENTPDSDFLLDRLPDTENAWLVGGGSGHGFKFGPAWGARVAATVLGERPVDAKFGMARWARSSPSSKRRDGWDR